MESFIYEAYRGELFGIEFFRSFAEQAKIDAERKKWACVAELGQLSVIQKKWETLIELEKLTASLLKNWLEKNGVSCSWEDHEMEIKGKKTAEPWLHLQWQTLMNTMEPWIKQYADEYRQNAEQAPCEQQAIYNITAAHEEAILAFIQAERRGDVDSLRAVYDFIEENRIALDK